MSSFFSKTSKGNRVFITIFFQINKLRPARINTFQCLICFDICYQNNQYFEPLRENSSINKGLNASCSLLVIPYVLIWRKKTESPYDHKNLSFLILVALIGLALRRWYDNKNPVVGKRIIPEVPIPVADQKDCGLWKRDWDICRICLNFTALAFLGAHQRANGRWLTDQSESAHYFCYVITLFI